MKTKGRLMLLLMLVVALGLSALTYYGLGQDKQLSVNDIKQGLDLSGGVDIVYEADKEDVTDEEMAAAISLLQGRLDWNGWTEAEAAREGANRIRVQIPGVDDAEEAIQEIGQTAQLAFVDEAGNVLLTGNMIKNATKQVGATSKNGPSTPYVSLEFNDEGKERFAQATEANIGKVIRIVMDEEVISSPVVQTKITDGNAMISGQFTGESAENLAALIRAGSLPFNLNVIQMKNVGARLGADALSTGVLAGLVGIALVLVYMVCTYRMLGFAADWALIIYIALDLIVLSLFNVTLTLPGIAGIILSIGMAVDANVVIFERIKEELILGKTLRSAVKTGFSRALPAIIDGNVTTLIAAVVLFFLGSGTVKGFATTLMIGIIISMFTALVVTRIIVNSLIKAGFHNPKNYGFRVR
ncbi:protein translocase subunit SecD [Anaerotignum sp.]|uniref:protein translocase subunit SecD n=1 Tax=Anaerotignum sp. TaxID=2039241 RepID=UPI0028ABB2BB|nr:protein translocase subunit SecD [Anaerotignum sp.]